MNIDRVLKDYFASQWPPPCPVLNPPEKANSRFRIGQVVEARAVLLARPETGVLHEIVGRVKNIAAMCGTYYYLIWDEEGSVWSAPERDVRRPQEVPDGWEPKESK